MKKREVVTPSANKHKAYVPLEAAQREDETARLFRVYLDTFSKAPEADFLLKRYFFNVYFDFEKECLQKNTFLSRVRISYGFSPTFSTSGTRGRLS